jgi:Ser/Thr protein kinase RdoA (MazF antagonist)
MYEFAVPKVLTTYGVVYNRIYAPQKGYRNEIWPVKTNNGQMLNVTFYKREAGIVDRIRYANLASEYLSACGLPTRQRFDRRTLVLRTSFGVTNINIYNYLPGVTIPWEAYTMSHIKNLGMVMSNMHSHLSDMPIEGFSSVYDEYLQIIKRMKRYFSEIAVQKAISQKLNIEIKVGLLDKYLKLLNKSKTQPGQQVLHMDFVRGNILFDNQEISGILDFEKTAVGHTIMDISRTLAFLLVDCKYKTSDKVNKYFLYSGYKKRGQTKDIGDDTLRNQLVVMFLIYDLYKFLRHNPYESLSMNEHYIRTRDILVKSGVLLLK